MPRGIPNAKKDETGFRYTTFHVPLATNPKLHGTSYLKSETQAVWFRNSMKKVPEATMAPEPRRGSQVLVIHPGSRFLRIGRASDISPVTVPNVIARKMQPPVLPPTFVAGITHPRRAPLEENGEHATNRPFDEQIADLSKVLRDRMKFYKIRHVPNSFSSCLSFNESLEPESIAEHNDPFRIEWLDDSGIDILVGEKALHLTDPYRAGYVVRWPMYGPSFNTRDYPSIQLIMSDVEEILRTTLRDKYGIAPPEYTRYSVVLVIPDFYDRDYVRSMVNILLVSMGFRQICAQQESMAATYGAGLTNACVVDIGAKGTSVSCVEDGLVIADSRMSLGIGGDDITEFLYVLLKRIGFPYKEISLARSYDWNILEELKIKMQTLTEDAVSLSIYDFIVRKPGKPAKKYGLRAYDEVILAPMCLFECKVIDYDMKRLGMKPIMHSDVTEEILEHASDHVTSAMMISTQHLMPAVQTSVPIAPPKASLNTELPSATSGVVDAMELDDEHKSIDPNPLKAVTPEPTDVNPSNFGGIDVCFEASKLPLDVAIFNSARAAGGDEKIRKHLQTVLIIGGCALIPGMAHALESRLQAIATPLVQNMEKVQIVPSPKDLDPRILAWKGAAVLGKMDSVSELWVTAVDWDYLGMRGLKERCFYL